MQNVPCLHKVTTAMIFDVSLTKFQQLFGRVILEEKQSSCLNQTRPRTEESNVIVLIKVTSILANLRVVHSKTIRQQEKDRSLRQLLQMLTEHNSSICVL